MTAIRIAILAAIAWGLAGCAGSPPIHYHTLAGQPTAGSPGTVRLLVEILPPTVPERLNRTELVLTGASGRLDVKDQDQWGAPLPDEIRQVMADTLWTELAAADVYNAPVAVDSSGLPQYRLALRVERFDAVPGGAVRVEAAWTIRRLPLGASITCRTSVDQPLPDPTPDAAAAALAQATRGLAKAIAASLGRLNLEMANACAQ